MDPVPGKQEMHPCQMSGQQEQLFVIQKHILQTTTVFALFFVMCGVNNTGYLQWIK